MPNSTEMVAEADFMRAGDLPEMHCSSKTNGARAYAPAPLFMPGAAYFWQLARQWSYMSEQIGLPPRLA